MDNIKQISPYMISQLVFMGDTNTYWFEEDGDYFIFENATTRKMTDEEKKVIVENK